MRMRQVKRASVLNAIIFLAQNGRQMAPAGEDAQKTARNVYHGDLKVDLGGGATGKVGAPTEELETVMGVASSIWAEVRASGVKAEDEEGCNAMTERLRKKYNDFAVSYPLPFRWMIQAQEYDAGAFKKYLRFHVKPMYKDRKEFMQCQGEYLTLLYKARNPRAGAKQITRYRAAIQKSLEEDDTIFTKAREDAEREVKEMDAAADADRRQRMVAYLKKQQAGTTSSPPPQQQGESCN